MSLMGPREATLFPLDILRLPSWSCGLRSVFRRLLFLFPFLLVRAYRVDPPTHPATLVRGGVQTGWSTLVSLFFRGRVDVLRLWSILATILFF